MSEVALKVEPNYPSWLKTSAVTFMVGLIKKTCEDAGCNGSVGLKFLTRQNILSKKNVAARSVWERHSSSDSSATIISIFCVGEDVRNDRAEALISMPSMQCKLLRAHLKQNARAHSSPSAFQALDGLKLVLAGSKQPKPDEKGKAPSRPATETIVPVDPELPEIDEEATAIFLDSLRAVGSEVTLSTADAVADQVGADPVIIDTAMAHGHLLRDGPLLRISPKGTKLMERVMANGGAPPAESQMHRFDQLRAEVLQARQEWQRLDDLAKAQKENNDALEKKRASAAALAQIMDEAQRRYIVAKNEFETCRDQILEMEARHREYCEGLEEKVKAAQQKVKDVEKEWAALTAL